MRIKDPIYERNKRQSILDDAWDLFREKGFEATTIQDIIRKNHCSKGKFYYYFHSKAELLSTLYECFDEKYAEIYGSVPKDFSAIDKIIQVQKQMFSFLRENVGNELLSNLYIVQLEHKTGINFWNESRIINKIYKEIIEKGIEDGELRSDLNTGKMVNDIIALERSCLIDWCLQSGGFDLEGEGLRRMNLQMQGYAKKNECCFADSTI